MNNADRALLTLAQAQHGVLSRHQALREGLSASAIDRRLATGQWVRVFQGAYRLAGVRPTWEQTVMAGCLAAGADAVASHRSAAALLGMPGAPRWVEITVPRPRQVSVGGVIAHRTRVLPLDDTGTVRRIPVTTAGRTIADLASFYSKNKLGPMLDYSLANRLVTRADLEARATGRKHDAVLRELLDDRPATVRPIGSEFEASLFRGLREAGLPLPVAQYRVLMGDGSLVFLDFAYPEVKLAIEADSYLWHASLAAWQRDRARNGELVALGWSILPITYDLATFKPAEVARRVRGALEARLAVISSSWLRV
ncbi:MAG TPA: type IV toxin-antitoxin system AbiEi family antitoxin domain-containing protein [Actinomycetota bacterium]